MSRAKFPVTQAIRALRAAKVPFEEHLYDYVARGGTAASAAALGVSEHVVIKTIVLEDDTKAPLIALMHGDREVSTKALGRHLGVKTVRACEPKVANKHSGYVVGGTSPFGFRRACPVFAPESVVTLADLYINAGARGFLVRISGDVLRDVIAPTLVDCAA